MHKNFKSIFFLSIPLLFKYIFLFFFIDLDLFNSYDIKEDLLFYFGIILLLSSNISKRQFFINTICFIYIFYLILETTSYMAVSVNFSSSYMYLLLESNKQELGEFASAYINTPIILFIILSFILFFIIRKKRFVAYKKLSPIIGIFGFIGIIAILKFTGLIESNAYHNIVRGTYGYIDLQNSIQFIDKINKEDIKINTDNNVLVVVLGESTARGHMQLYGYNRETTPLLNAIRDSLYIYNNVISTDVFTLKSVPKMLTPMDVNSKKDKIINIVEVFNAASYKTLALSLTCRTLYLQHVYVLDNCSVMYQVVISIYLMPTMKTHSYYLSLTTPDTSFSIH